MKKIESYTAHKQEGILLNANENSNNVSSTLLEEMKKGMEDVLFNRYPDDDCTELLEAYSKYVHIDANQILCGNGSDQMLGLMIGYYLGKGKTLYTIRPDFSMYDYYATSYEANILKYECEEDGSFDIDSFIEMGLKNDVKLVIFSNPNNPTGHFLSNEECIKIVEGFKGIPVIVDEAYVEFAKESMVSFVNQYDNLFVTRTLSKAFGFAGMRCGFLCGPKQAMRELKASKVPYALSSLTMKLSTILLSHVDEYKQSIVDIKKRRDALISKPYKKIKIYPSQGNFVMVRTEDNDVCLKLFEENNIVLRTYKNCDYFRITIGNEEEMKIVESILDAYDKEA